MPAKSKIDSYSNLAAMLVTETAANTQTTGKFQFPFSIMDKVGLIIHRIEYEFATLLAPLNSSGDWISIAITCMAAVTDPDDVTDPAIIDGVRLSRYDLGAAASGILFRQPVVKDFANFPGNGLLVAPNPLYLLVQGHNCGAASAARVRLYYTYIELASDEYWQLVESRRIITSV